MDLRMKILYLLEEMDGLCLDNEEERMEAAARLERGLCPPPETAEDGDLDDLIGEIADFDRLDWDHSGDDWHLSIGDGTRIIRMEIHDAGSSSNIGLVVCGQPMKLRPEQRMELFKMCHRLGAREQREAVAIALRAVRLRKQGK